MSLVAIGLNHRSVPLDLLEAMTIDGVHLPKVLHDVAGKDHVSEAVILSTCNRTEVYVIAERFHGAYRDVRTCLSEASGLPPEAFSDHLYLHHDDQAVSHLFGVAAGLDSVVVGEAEILGQVRDAWETARAEGTAGSSLNLLFRHALEVGKRVRTETAFSSHIASVSSAAVAMAGAELGTLQGRSILVLGAGDMGESMARALSSQGVDELLIANRTWDRAVEVASRLGGAAVRLADLADRLLHVDLLLTSTGATSMILEHGDMAKIMSGRRGRPLLIVDIAVPRDVDPSATDIDGVTLLDMEDLRAFAEAGVEERRGELDSVGGIVAEEIERFVAVSHAREVAPLIGDLHSRAEQIREHEMARFRTRLSSLGPDQIETVEALTRGLVAKLLHDPSVILKDAAGSPRGERLADSLRDLFDL